MNKSKSKNLPPDCRECPARGKSVFCGLDADELEQVDHRKIRSRYAKGQTIFAQGNPPFGIFCVAEGNIKVTQTSAQGKESIVRIAKPGDVLGHRSLFTRQLCSATATSLEETKVCFIEKSHMKKLLKRSPKIVESLIFQLAQNLGETEQRISSYHQSGTKERLAQHLLKLKESHGKETPEGTKLEIKLSRQEWASIIGSANETLIRFMTELKNAGFIEERLKTIYIRNEDGLKSFINPRYRDGNRWD